MAEEVMDTQVTQNAEPQTADVQDTQSVDTQSTVLADAPIQYTDFTMPEGFDAPSDEFLAITKELGINQEGVQKVVDYYTNNLVPQIIEQQRANIAKQNEEWSAQAMKDLGKDGVDRARLAFKEFSTPELTELLNETGLGSHPAVVAMFAKIGEQTGESTLINGKSVPAEPKRAADVLFG